MFDLEKLDDCSGIRVFDVDVGVYLYRECLAKVYIKSYPNYAE